jgi:hypothetical protein
MRLSSIQPIATRGDHPAEWGQNGNPMPSEHTNPGGEGCVAVNSSDLPHAGLPFVKSGFFIQCMQNACVGRDRLDFVAEMLRREWLTDEDLTAPEFLADGGTTNPLPNERASLEGFLRLLPYAHLHLCPERRFMACGHGQRAGAAGQGPGQQKADGCGRMAG